MQVPDTNRNVSTAQRGIPYLLWLVWIVWLALLIPPIVNLIQSDISVVHLVVTLGLLSIFVGIYMSATWRNIHTLRATPPITIPTSKWLTVAVCMGLSVVIGLLGHGHDWLDPFVLTSAFVSGSLPPRKAIATVGVLILLILSVGLLGNLTVGDFGAAIVIVTVVSITTITVVRSIVAGQELRAAREEITHLAVMNERLRIARDLHDLLGHSLSLITLKSELAGRLISVAPDRAAVEIRDIESVARTTLQEVREAVALYRQPTLSSELRGAREILAAAGIAFQYEADEHIIEILPQPSEAVFAWAVREGVTNVIRHSRARQCTIRLTHTPQTASVEVIDNGIGVKVAGTNISGGNGLSGLRERVALLNGQFESTPCPNGGFRLAVTVPVEQQERG